MSYITTSRIRVRRSPARLSAPALRISPGFARLCFVSVFWYEALRCLADLKACCAQVGLRGGGRRVLKHTHSFVVCVGVAGAGSPSGWQPQVQLPHPASFLQLSPARRTSTSLCLGSTMSWVVSVCLSGSHTSSRRVGLLLCLFAEAPSLVSCCLRTHSATHPHSPPLHVQAPPHPGGLRH